MWQRECQDKLCAFISAVSEPRAIPSHHPMMPGGFLLLSGSRALVLMDDPCTHKDVVGFACISRAPLPEGGS